MPTNSFSWLSPIRRAGEAQPDGPEQLEWERRTRVRLGVPVAAGGVLYMLSGIIVSSALSAAPTVGLLQALKGPVAEGIAEPSSSPRTSEVEFVSHHAFALIAGSALSALSLIILTATLLLLVRATRFRRPESWAPTATLVLLGGIGFAAVSLGHEIAEAVLTHAFTVSANHSNSAVEHALTKGPANVVSDYISLIAGLFLAAGMIVTTLGAMRVGLIARWMGIVGALAGLLIFLPIGGAELEIIPAFWMVAMGILLMGRWPNGDPPAWEAGEARPWPSSAETRAQQQQVGGRPSKGKRPSSKPATAASTNGGDGEVSVPGALPPGTQGGTAAGRRRRKHGSQR